MNSSSSEHGMDKAVTIVVEAVEHQWPKGEITYLGTKGTHLDDQIELHLAKLDGASPASDQVKRR